MYEPPRAIEIESEDVLHAAFGSRNGAARATGPKLLNVEEVRAMQTCPPTMLIESLLSTPGLTMLNAPGKTGKTLLAAQMGMSIASGVPLFDFYRVLSPGPVLFLEKDDPSGAASIKEILLRTKLPIDGTPFFVVDTADAQKLTLGSDFHLWLDSILPREGIRLAVLDSYTSLRATRQGGGDFVKGETEDLSMLDQLGKKHGTSILLNHHYSKGSASLDWSERAGGSFAMLATPEAQITMTRFLELPINARERLIRVRGRRFEDVEMVLRFDPETLSFEHVLEGGAAAFFCELQNLRTSFGDAPFSPKSLQHETGMARATAHRLIGRLAAVGALSKTGYGEYRLDVRL